MFLSYIKLTASFFSSEEKSKEFVLFCVLRRKNVFVNVLFIMIATDK